MALRPKPVAVPFPFAAGRNEPVRHQDLQDLIPSRALAVRQLAVGPEPIQQ
jgi:hypothetical protein